MPPLEDSELTLHEIRSQLNIIINSNNDRRNDAHDLKNRINMMVSQLDVHMDGTEERLEKKLEQCHLGLQTRLKDEYLNRDQITILLKENNTLIKDELMGELKRHIVVVALTIGTLWTVITTVLGDDILEKNLVSENEKIQVMK